MGLLALGAESRERGNSEIESAVGFVVRFRQFQ